MESYVRPPEPLSGHGNMAQNWQRWKKDFNIFLKASNNVKKSKDVKAYLLRGHIGSVGLTAIDKVIPSGSEDRDDINILLAKLDTYFEPPKNEIVERYIFFTRTWAKNETIDNYIDDLKKKAATCNFGPIMNSLIRDKIIVGIKDADLRNKIFETKNLDLFKLAVIYKEHINAISDKKSKTNAQHVGSNATDANTKTVHKTNSVNTGNLNTNVNDAKLSEQASELKIRENKRNCWRCYEKHATRACPAWGFKCEKCGERNHFTKCCQHGNANHQKQESLIPKTKPVNLLDLHLNVQKDHFQTMPPQNYNMREHVRPSYIHHPNMSPSAPQLPDDRNVLYPNLKSVGSPENSRQWSWVDQSNQRVNENFQKNASMDMQSTQTKPAETQPQGSSSSFDDGAHAKGDNKAKSNNNECVIS